MTRALFVLEQHLGHQTYAANLRRFVEAHDRISTDWAPITYHGSARWVERLPGMPERVRGLLHGRAQVRRALAAPHDVAFFNTQAPAALSGISALRRPYVIATDITPRQYDQVSTLYNHRADRPGPTARYKHHVNTLLLRRAASLLPWSNWVRESLIHDYGVASERIEVIPPGIDLEHWRPGASERSGPLQLLFVGGDLVRKGGAILLEAFRSLPHGVAELHLVTRTPLAPEPGVHTYFDMQPNEERLVQLYRTADVFVLPTAAEAFGIAAAEASASGLPVIATAVGGLPDIVATGENGYLVPPGDSAAIAQHIQRLAADRDLCARMGQAARARAEARFDARRNAARIITILEAAATAARAATLPQNRLL